MLLTPPRRAQLFGIPDGASGTRATLNLMRRIARDFRGNLELRDMADLIVSLAGVPEKDYVGEAKALYQYVRDNIRYTLDSDDMEVLQTPLETLNRGQGDCDDKALLLASLLIIKGHPSQFYAIGSTPGVIEHVLVRTKIGDRWIAAETTENVEFGWSPPKVAQSMIVNI